VRTEGSEPAAIWVYRLRPPQPTASRTTCPIRATTCSCSVARAARHFGDGFAVIVLPAYLSAIGYAGPDRFVATAAHPAPRCSCDGRIPRAALDLRGLLIAGAFS
jgi:hypothetical protein